MKSLKVRQQKLVISQLKLYIESVNESKENCDRTNNPMKFKKLDIRLKTFKLQLEEQCLKLKEIDI